MKLNENPLTEKPGDAGWTPASLLVVFLEMAGLFAVLTGLGYVLTGNAGFVDAPVHPYWLVVLFMAAHYGITWGLFGAVAASALHILAMPVDAIFIRPPLTAIENNGILIAAWILAAALVGAYRDRWQGRVEAARDARDAAEAERDALGRYGETLARENAELRACLARGGPGDGLELSTDLPQPLLVLPDNEG